MENDFVDVFPSAGGVGDSPVKGQPEGSSTSNARSLSLSLTSQSHPGLHTGGGREALVSPRHPSLAKEGGLRSARAVPEAGEAAAAAASASAAAREEDVEMTLEQESEDRPSLGLALSIDPVDDCAYVPTELEKKKAKLEKYRYECSEVGGVRACAERPENRGLATERETRGCARDKKESQHFWFLISWIQYGAREERTGFFFGGPRLPLPRWRWVFFMESSQTGSFGERVWREEGLKIEGDPRRDVGGTYAEDLFRDLL